MSLYLSQLVKDLLYIGVCFRPRRVKNAAYVCRVLVFGCYVLSCAGSGYGAQNKIAMDICQALNAQKVLKFPNGTAMRIDWNNKLSFGTDELRTGQLYTEGTYCYLTPIEPSEKLKYINIKTKGVSENG